MFVGSGKWIDLPHGENGNKPSKEEYAMTNSVAYMEGGPYQVRKPANDYFVNRSACAEIVPITQPRTRNL